ncbi:MAG: DJ-1/PfpI family protein [Burkholderiales bacterium]
MANDPDKGRFGEPTHGKIAVLIEEHFDQTEFFKFNDVLPAAGFQVEYVSHLWGQPSLHFRCNPDDGRMGAEVTVTTEVAGVEPTGYKAILLIGAYAMDRLRYQEHVRPGQPNNAPAVAFVRKALATPGVKVGTICHSLWLLCADREMLRGRKVTCAHNIVCDVENAGGQVVYEGDATADLVIDGDLISGKHPGVVDQFLERLLAEFQNEGAVSHV